MAFACAGPWCREEALRRGAYALGACTFELTALEDDAAAAAEVGQDRWREHQSGYAAALEGGRLSRSSSPPSVADRQLSRHVKRLSIVLLKDEDAPGVRGGGKERAEEAGALPALSHVIAWWCPPSLWTVHLSGRRCSLPDLEALSHMARTHWGCPVTGLSVEGYSRPNAEEERASIARLMTASADTLRLVQVECLEMPPPPPPPPHTQQSEHSDAQTGQGTRGEVRRLVLNHCATKLAVVSAWLRGSPLEALFLSYDSPFEMLHLRPSEKGRAAGGEGGGASPVTELTALTPPTLRHLMLDQTNATPEHIKSIRCRSSLERLSLIDCDQMDEVDLTDMVNLRALLLSRCPISSTDSLVNLAHCQRLVLLNLSGCSGLSDINAVAELGNLKELFAYQIDVVNAGIRDLGRCTLLEKVNLGGCQRISNVAPLGSLTRLKQLHLWGTRVDNNGIAALGGCTALSELVLDSCARITDVTPLASLQNLRWLSLISTNVTPLGVAALARCPRLEALAIAGTEIANAPRLWDHHSVLAFLERVVVD